MQGNLNNAHLLHKGGIGKVLGVQEGGMNEVQ